MCFFAGDGKSSFINALAGKYLCAVGHLLRQTVASRWYELSLGHDKINILDTRGASEYEPPENISVDDSWTCIGHQNPLRTE